MASFFLAFVFLVTIVATDSVGGHLRYSDLLIIPLAGALAVLWLGSGPAPLTRAQCLLIVSILAYGGVLTAIASAFLTESPRPLVHVMFMARVVGLFVVLGFFSWLAQRSPRGADCAFIGAAVVVLGYWAWTAAFSEFGGYYGYLGLPGTPAPLQSGFACGLLAITFLGLSFASGHMALHLGLAILMAVGTVGTISRANILALVLTTGLLPIAYAAVHGRRARAVAMGASIVVVIACALGLIWYGLLPDPLQQSAEYALQRFGETEAAVQERVTRWLTFFELPPIPGALGFSVGLGPGAHNVLYRSDGFVLRFDSLFVRTLYEWGIFGTTLWVLLFASVVTHIRHLSRRYLLLSTMMLMYGAVVGITHEWLFVGIPGYLFMAALGACIGWARNDAERSSTPPESLTSSGS